MHPLDALLLIVVCTARQNTGMSSDCAVDHCLNEAFMPCRNEHLAIRRLFKM